MVFCGLSLSAFASGFCIQHWDFASCTIGLNALEHTFLIADPDVFKNVPLMMEYMPPGVSHAFYILQQDTTIQQKTAGVRIGSRGVDACVSKPSA